MENRTGTRSSGIQKRRLRVYYGNIGEIVAQEVLRRQGFEVWLPRPIAVADGQDFFRFPRMEPLDNLRRHYDNYPASAKEKFTWKQFIERQKWRHEKDKEAVRQNQAFFGG